MDIYIKLIIPLQSIVHNCFFNMLYIPTEDNYKNTSKEYNVTLKNRLLQYILLLRESFFGNGSQKINLPRKKEKIY